MTPEPFDPKCGRFARDMAELNYLIIESEDEDESAVTDEQRAQYIRDEDGTYNPENGHFLCDACYIAAGMPSGPNGWKCP